VKEDDNKESNNDDGGIDFSKLSTNTSVNKLRLRLKSKSDLIRTNLFESIKVNQTLKKLHLNFYGMVFQERERTSFIEMLRENITLIEVLVPVKDLDREIGIQTELNRMWKRFIRKREERVAATTATTVAAATPAINNTYNNVVPATIVNATVVVVNEREQQQDDDEEEEENNNGKKKIEEEVKMEKKKEEICIYLEIFKKPLMRNEIIFSYLTQNADMYNVR